MGTYSHLLFADPTFMSGAASLLDFGGFLFEFNRSNNATQADLQAIRRDWMQIYEDFSNAHQAFLKGHPECQNARGENRVEANRP